MAVPLYDAGALIAADRHDRAFWSLHRAFLESGARPITTAPVVAQVSRSPKQVGLRRLLQACEIVDFADSDAHPVGRLLASAGTSDVVDGHVARTAIRSRATIVTSDPNDFRDLLASVDEAPPVHRI